MTALRAGTHEAPADALEFHHWALEAGWSDGLPSIHPTADRVEAMLAANGLDGDSVIGAIEPDRGIATMEKVAINAVMAGCRPEDLPVLVAVVEACIDEELNLHGIQCTTNAGGPAVIVNGPVRDRVGIAYGSDALGPGNPANQAIGRALRLVLRNIGGGIRPVDRATLGSPWKMGLVVGENERLNPWEPLHVEKGFAPDDSVVTVFNVESVHNIPAIYTDAEAVLVMLARSMTSGLNVNFSYGTPCVLLSGGHAAILADGGYTKQQVKHELFERAKVPLQHLPRQGNIDVGEWVVEDGRVLITRSPDEILVVVAGDEAPYHSAYLTGWGLSRYAMRRVHLPT